MLLKQTRLAALLETPTAFGVSYQTAAQYTDEPSFQDSCEICAADKSSRCQASELLNQFHSLGSGRDRIDNLILLFAPQVDLFCPKHLFSGLSSQPCEQVCYLLPFRTQSHEGMSAFIR